MKADDLLEIISFLGMLIMMPLFIICWAVDMSVKRKMEEEK